MTISFIVVAHRSSSVLPGAVSSFRREAGALGVSAEVVVVEQSEDDGERDAALATRPEHSIVLPNRGYAAGINAGARLATGGVLLLSNPDVVFRPGSLGPLLDALSSGVALAGPQFELAGCLFPPADEQTPFRELLRFGATRAQTSWRWFMRRELERSFRIWRTRDASAVDVSSLSGALVATRRDRFDQLGPWDEQYFLYFEETDWQRRAARAGLRRAIVPGSRVEHAWGHASDPRAAASGRHFERSRALYYRRHFGVFGRAVTTAFLSRRALAFDPSPARPDGQTAHHLISPSPAGFHAAWIEAGTDDPAAVVTRLVQTTGRPMPFFHLTFEETTGRIAGPTRVSPPD